jgi:hypothetical protein
MRHQRFKEWIPLFVYDELDEDEKFLLEEHLAACTDCRERLTEIRGLRSFAGKKPEVGDQLLEQARRELRINLNARERQADSWFSNWDRSFWLPSLRTALTGAFCLAFGLVLGHFIYKPDLTAESGAILTRPVLRSPVSPGEIAIGSVRFIDVDRADGQVEFTYEAVTPFHFRGSVNDQEAQAILSQVLTDAKNPGNRLRAAGMLGTEQLKQPDAEVKRALIGALKLDENNGVRRQALAALLNFPFDNEIRDTLLFVLMNDANPAMRIAAIDGIKTERFRDPEVLRVLQEKSQTDGNEYIRLRSRAVLEEVNVR